MVVLPWFFLWSLVAFLAPLLTFMAFIATLVGFMADLAAGMAVKVLEKPMGVGFKAWKAEMADYGKNLSKPLGLEVCKKKLMELTS